MTRALARATITHSLRNDSAFARELQKAAAGEMASKVNAIGLDAVRRTEANIAADFVNDRIPQRRKPGRHLLGSIRHRLIWDGVNFPIRLEIYSLATPAKVNSLEFGAAGHTIAGSLVFPYTPAGQRGTGNQAKKPYGPLFTGTKNKFIKTPSVKHPGTQNSRPDGWKFMRRGLDAAVEAALGSVAR